MSLDNGRAAMTTETLNAIHDAKTRSDRAGASEFGPGLSRNRQDVAPLVNRNHRRTASPPPIKVTSARPHPGRPRPRLAD
ncbi:hypothetical protein MCNF_27250 [Mycolicibacterium confluentis]|uniref:Uncharacterized protein n=1 Tax=Mycolicibacterium confluentis TaxID=28047 RepID=A0A7I7XXQ4_9MYCO|nr:hypothetical protein MCNF_27250 [Mycolicibacterium confluentis]